MEKMRRSHALAVFLTVALTAGVVWAETLEFVTYYPAGNSGLPDPLYVNSEGVGAGYNGQATPTNGLAVQGRVGLGTRTPAGLLDIQSVLTGTNEDLLLVRGPDDAVGRVIFIPGNDTAAAGGPALNVGIGTANPLSGVDIVRGYDALYLRLRSTGFGDPDNYCAINMNADLGNFADETDDMVWQLNHSRAAVAPNDFRFMFRDYNAPGGGNWQPILTLKHTTNVTADIPLVGIGTATPNATIGINGNAVRSIRMERHTGAGAGGNPLVVQAGGANVGGTDLPGGDLYLSGGISTGGGGSNVFFLTAPEGSSGTADRSPTTKMTVTPNGNVGIGLNNPGSALTVYRGVDASYVSAWGTGDGDNFAALNLVSDQGTNKQWQIAHKQSPANAFQIGYHDSAWSFPFTITTAGNVGINKTAPTAPLDVTGDIRASGDVYARGVMLTSDSRLKSDVLPLTGVLEKLDQIHGVSFRWSDAMVAQGAPADRREIGLIAQEVEKVFPELVKQAEYKGIDYSKMTAVLLEAVKELKAENESLKKRIELLEKKEK